MRLQALEISNFKALTHFELSDVGDAVVLAGPNGCGKSCVLDAIRLLKSAYAGYNPNEWHSWFGEFQINFNQRPQDLVQLLQDPARELRISGHFSFASEEKDYVRQNAISLLTEAAWREVVPELAAWRSFVTTSFASQYRAHSPEVERRVAAGMEELAAELERETYAATVTIDSSGIGRTDPSRLLEIAFGIYEPDRIGVMEFFGANRQYTRETVGGINLDVSGVAEQRRQNALYNIQNKYQGLKGEMASAYVRRVLAEQAEGPAHAGDETLVESLQELFATFFPGKRFLGPQPTTDGRVVFPVKLADGSTHDLDDLSAGEKEVLYGYMRLRNAAPRNSVILVDEPEMHLNPRLIRGLARFYYNHLVVGSGNQLWLISHSDTLLREAVNLDGFDVFHMRAGDRMRPTENQATLVQPGDEIEHFVIELVGDLAAYRPGAKVVLFEGGGDVEFDVRMVARLFPGFDGAVNAIAAGSKRRVAALHDVLERVASSTLGARFYAVVDRDSDRDERETGARLYAWDAYHIENYLLEPEFILRSLNELSQADDSLQTVESVNEALKACAEGTMGGLVSHRLIRETSAALREALKVGGDPNAAKVAPSVAASVMGARERVVQLVGAQLGEDHLAAREDEIRAELNADLQNEKWRKTFRGRDVLKSFAHRHAGVNYEAFRDSVLARMKDAGHRPGGMADVLQRILEDPFPDV